MLMSPFETTSCSDIQRKLKPEVILFHPYHLSSVSPEFITYYLGSVPLYRKPHAENLGFKSQVLSIKSF